VALAAPGVMPFGRRVDAIVPCDKLCVNRAFLGYYLGNDSGIWDKLPRLGIVTIDHG
jgi:hypothetical protein